MNEDSLCSCHCLLPTSPGFWLHSRAGGSTVLSLQGALVLGEDAEVQILYQKTDWEKKTWPISWRRQRKSDWCSQSECAGHKETMRVLTFWRETPFCDLELYLNIQLSLVHKAPAIPRCPLQWVPGIHFRDLSVSLISAPQQVSEIYTTVCPCNFTHFCVNLERWEKNYSWLIVIFYSFLVHGFVSMEQFGFQVIQILSHYFLFVMGQLLPYFIWNVRQAALLWTWKGSSKKASARSGATAKVVINFTSSAGFCNQHKLLWNLFQQGNGGRQTFGSKLENYYSYKPVHTPITWDKRRAKDMPSNYTAT